MGALFIKNISRAVLLQISNCMVSMQISMSLIDALVLAKSIWQLKIDWKIKFFYEFFLFFFIIKILLTKMNTRKSGKVCKLNKGKLSSNVGKNCNGETWIAIGK